MTHPQPNPPEKVESLAAIISDAEIIRVHGRANFGNMDPREVVNDGVRKTAIGYHCGHTQVCILRAHGLITKSRDMSFDVNLTKKGKRYARALCHDALFRAHRPVEQEAVACVIAFREGKREPEFVSWNVLPTGEHRLYAASPPSRALSQDEREACGVLAALRYSTFIDEPHRPRLTDTEQAAICTLLNILQPEGEANG